MRVLVAVLAMGAALFVGPAVFTKENLVVLVVGLLTTIGLVRVVTHEFLCASNEMFPALTRIAEGYYALLRRLAELKADSRPSLPDRSR